MTHRALSAPSKRWLLVVALSLVASILAAPPRAAEPRDRPDRPERGIAVSTEYSEVLVKQPRVVFLDEPTVGLDPDGTQRMLLLIQSLSRERGITVLFSSHLLDQVQRISDRVGIMLGGRLAAAGPIAELARRSLGLGHERYTLEEIYMRYFRQEQPPAPAVLAGR
ncbi:MAG: hypothetical protein HYU51_10360 [Candidatus Rokubacteria bacterium]|nr:hypothetical protein [Candidatus Rokubacteria bacterium]